MTNNKEYKENLKRTRRNIARQKWSLVSSANWSTDWNHIQTMTYKIEMINIIRQELKILIKQL
jgi:hypothetical protein